MKEKNSEHLIYLSPINEADTVLKDIRTFCTGSDRLQISHSIAFSGQEFCEIALVLGTSRAIAAVGRVLVAWMEGKKSRVVKINGKEIQGYSAEEVERMLALESKADQK